VRIPFVWLSVAKKNNLRSGTTADPRMSELINITNITRTGVVTEPDVKFL